MHNTVDPAPHNTANQSPNSNADLSSRAMPSPGLSAPARCRMHVTLLVSSATQVFAVVFLSRGLLEELVFRVVLLPHPAVDGPTPPLNFAVR